MLDTRRSFLRRLGLAGLGLGAAGSGRARGAGGLPKGLALCVGVNRLDPRHYVGWEGRLGGCEADAWAMAQLARDAGFTSPRTLLTGQARREAVRESIRQAAVATSPGDIFLLHFSGHGGQIDDRSGDETGDHLDETWCLYDGMLIDDEMYDLWAEFKRGVRVLLMVDCCHSRTAVAPQAAGGTTAPLLILTGQRSLPTSQPVVAPTPPPPTKASPEAVSGATRVRSMPRGLVEYIFEKNRADYDATLARLRLEARGRRPVQCSGLTFSACFDNQEALDLGTGGLFTSALREVWDRGRFRGDYQQFYRLIHDRMLFQARSLRRPSQEPAYYHWGQEDPVFLAQPAFSVSI